MKKLSILASLLIPVVIVAFFLGLGNVSKAEASAGVASGKLSRPSAVIRVTTLFTPTHFVYLPFTCRRFPPAIHVPEGEYLLVEYWTHRVLSANCAGQCIDFPSYYFDPQSGELVIHSPHPTLALDDADVGYVGRGTSLGGVGGGASSDLSKVEWVPSSQSGITLRYVDESGGVTLEREGEAIVLEPGAVWASDEMVEDWDWLGAGCVVTSTSYVTNYAFQDRDKVVFASE